MCGAFGLHLVVWGRVAARSVSHPEHFRVAYGSALDGLLTQVVRGMADEGWVSFEAHAQDGMRVRASAGAASFHRQATLEKSTALISSSVSPYSLRPKERGMLSDVDTTRGWRGIV